MAVVTIIIGKSGAGKTSSIRTMDGRDDVMIIRPSKKRLQFRSGFKEWDADKSSGDMFFENIGTDVPYALETFAKRGKKIIIIEDSTFYMTDFFMKRAKEKGFEKFTNLGSMYYNILKAAENLDEDIRVYIVNHIEDDASGYKKVKTIGKLLDDKLDIPALVGIVLEARIIQKKNVFQTNKETDFDISKTPLDMFMDKFIPNDLDMVDKTICEYYDIDRLDTPENAYNKVKG